MTDSPRSYEEKLARVDEIDLELPGAVSAVADLKAEREVMLRSAGWITNFDYLCFQLDKASDLETRWLKDPLNQKKKAAFEAVRYATNLIFEEMFPRPEP